VIVSYPISDTSLAVTTTINAASSGGYSSWASTNGVIGDASADSNHDGVPNGIAYFMGQTGLATLPVLDATSKIAWPMSATYSGTYQVQTSADLSTWTAVSPQPTRGLDGNLSYTLPSGLGKQFVRLLVTPN